MSYDGACSIRHLVKSCSTLVPAFPALHGVRLGLLDQSKKQQDALRENPLCISENSTSGHFRVSGYWENIKFLSREI